MSVVALLCSWMSEAAVSPSTALRAASEIASEISQYSEDFDEDSGSGVIPQFGAYDSVRSRLLACSHRRLSSSPRLTASNSPRSLASSSLTSFPARWPRSLRRLLPPRLLAPSLQ